MIMIGGNANWPPSCTVVTIELMHGEKLDINVYDKTYKLEKTLEISAERGNEI